MLVQNFRYNLLQIDTSIKVLHKWKNMEKNLIYTYREDMYINRTKNITMYSISAHLPVTEFLSGQLISKWLELIIIEAHVGYL